jgi:BirA family transcriptional regulator, biotin operon repressor / biotin---[acetyl-CoA-carboxylase] ligase
MDHRWESPLGGLYLSLLLPVDPVPPTLLPLAIGARLADRLAERWSVPARLKWPNDVLVVREGEPVRKLSGILVDSVGAPGGLRVAVAGIGVNVRAPPDGFPDGLATPPVTLGELVRPVPAVREVEDLVVDAAERAAADLTSSEGPREVLDRVRARLYGVGRRVTVDGVPLGAIRGIDEDGALVLEADGGPMTIRAGDLRVLEP